MYDCSHLNHPFLHDPGTAQSDRALKALLPDNVRIDGRKMADLLNYFIRLSRQINFYDNNLAISDWSPFFSNGLPFILSKVAAHPLSVNQQKIAWYARMLEQNANPSGLQLLLCYSWYNFILPLNNWALQLQDTGVDQEIALNKLIKDNLQQPILSFINIQNTAARCYNIRKIDFSPLLKVPAWGLEQADLYSYQAGNCFAGGLRTRLLTLWQSADDTLSFFSGVISQISDGAADDVNNSLQKLLTLKGTQDLTPHLALLFAFLDLFGKLQSDLNSLTKRHLNYFFTSVLRLQPAPAVPDKAHIVFSIQKQLSQYLLDQGLEVKDGKDDNKVDILFGLDQQIVVNQAAITDTRTLFLNNQFHYDQHYVEGVYMAPNATMADGLTKPFADPSTASWPTLGDRWSKYIPAGMDSPIPYPSARLGFILHSPVLLLAEGTRTITINLACKYRNDACSNSLPGSLGMQDLLPDLQTLLGGTYVYFSQDSVAIAISKGLDANIGQRIIDQFLTNKITDCYGSHSASVYNACVNSTALSIFTATERTTITSFFPLRTVFQLQFSGAKGWLVPDSPAKISLTQTAPGGNEFGLQFTVTLGPDLPGVTPYDKKVFNVDYQTSDPVVMIQLDDAIKILYNSTETTPPCCLEPATPPNQLNVSTYHFFRNLQILEETSDKSQTTSIITDVCGMKDFVVQNDQNVMDVNSPIYPFGTRPSIIDFSPVRPDPFSGVMSTPNLRGPNFYIGSSEIFCKAWTSIWIGINWKDMPQSFNDYYAGYLHLGTGNSVTDYGLPQSGYQVNLAVLSDGKWLKDKDQAGAISPYATQSTSTPNGDHNRYLFDAESIPPHTLIPCTDDSGYQNSFYITPDNFPFSPGFTASPASLTRYNADTRSGFIRLTLENQDFLHKDYSYVLARQMIAFGKLPDNLVDGAIYYDPAFGYFVIDSHVLQTEYNALGDIANRIQAEATDIQSNAGHTGAISASPEAANIRKDLKDQPFPWVPATGLIPDAQALNTAVTQGKNDLNAHTKPSAVIPKEPWTPVIQNMVIHYSAKATIKDMDIIHLYPFDGTYQPMDIQAAPPLLPVYCEEGTLFLGLQNLNPGTNLNILFQLAEATADSEDAPDIVNWEYLHNNKWSSLQPDFQLISDATRNLTSSGIVELSLPNNLNAANTIMPAGLSWLRASVVSHSAGISETYALFTQAVRSTFVINPGDPSTNSPGSALGRLTGPLDAGSLSKLKDADSSVTQVRQPYPSFGGRIPESNGPAFMIRISELLRHKGRGIQKWDYERLVLQNYPQVLRAKCVNHTYFLNAHQYQYDFPMAPGNIMLALIPDIAQLSSSDSLQPRIPMSLLEDIHDWLSGIISPFIQLFVVNPRYEPIDFCLKVVLLPGMDEQYYQQQLKKDLTTWLAPWLTGNMDRFEFGQCIFRSDVIRFVENLDYVDYLLDLQMTHQGNPMPAGPEPPDNIEPMTPRSILIAGDIVVNIPDPPPYPGKPPIGPCGNTAEPIVDYCSATGTRPFKWRPVK